MRFTLYFAARLLQMRADNAVIALNIIRTLSGDEYADKIVAEFSEAMSLLKEEKK